jgi:hypothetical protein
MFADEKLERLLIVRFGEPHEFAIIVTPERVRRGRQNRS